jgi:hypothetical protein
LKVGAGLCDATDARKVFGVLEVLDYFGASIIRHEDCSPLNPHRNWEPKVTKGSQVSIPDYDHSKKGVAWMLKENTLLSPPYSYFTGGK